MIVNYIQASVADKSILRSVAQDESYLASYCGPQTVADMRSGNKAMGATVALRQSPEHVTVEPTNLGGVPCERLTTGRATGRNAIVFLHGGGFVRGSLETGRPCAGGLAALSDIQVFAVGYRQAPEHPYPAALADARSAYLAVIELGVEPSNIVLAGESCGGCLALSLPIDLEERALPSPAGIAAICPLTDLVMRGASYAFNRDKDLITREMGLLMTAHYIPETDRRSPLASPVYHHFRGFPPVFIGVGEHELLISEAEYLALKADDAGVHVTFNVYDSMPHSFTRYRLAIGDALLTDAAGWCRSVLDREVSRPEGASGQAGGVPPL